MERNVTGPHGREAFGVMGSAIRVVADEAATGGAWEAAEITVSPGAGSPPHTVHGDKAFLVLDGEVTVMVDGEDHAGRPGDVVHIPAGTPHRYLNVSGAPARLLVITTGGGHMAFLRGMGRLTADGPPDPGALAAHTAAPGVRILAPAGG